METGYSRKNMSLNLDWFTEYRSCQVLFAHINAFIGDACLPFTIYFLVLICSLAIFTVIRVRTGIQIIVVGIAFSIFCFLYLVTFLDRMSKLTAIGEKGLASKRDELTKRANPYYQRLMKSCTRLTFRFGSIQSVDRCLVVTSAHTIINLTASLLLAAT